MSVMAFILVLVALVAPGCATGYLEGRWQDARDILTATVETDTVGVKAQLGPWTGLGVYGSSPDARGIGLVGGQVTSYDFTDSTYPPFLGSIQRFRNFTDDRRRKEFHFVQSYFLPYIRPQTDPTGFFGGFEGADDWRRVAPRYTQVEVAIGMWFGLRLGMNPGELIDFLAGWAGLDLYGDDVGVERGTSNVESAESGARPGPGRE